MPSNIRQMLAAALCGSALMLLPGAAAAESIPGKVHVLYKFSGGKDGGSPYGPLVADASGNLYGVTLFGGDAGLGVVFELSPSVIRSGTWTETVLHSFGGADGAYPSAGLTLDAQGNLFGTTFGCTESPCGVAFELSPGANGAWSYAVLFAFGNPDSRIGSGPNGELVLDAGGNVYGTTQYGGTGSCTNNDGPCGIVFELSPGHGNRASTETVLHSFTGIPDGAFPYGSVVFDGSGNLFGTTNEGGTGKCGDGEGTRIGCGTVFELSSSGGVWSETRLYDFKASEQNMPGSTLTLGHKGTLFGTAGYDVFRLTSPKQQGGSWKKKTIYQFTEGIAGTIPSSGVAVDSHGDLYGTTSSSGLDGYSTVYELSPPAGGTGPWTETTLARLGKGFDSNQPRGGVLLLNGVLYGAASGTAGRGYVFSIDQ